MLNVHTTFNTGLLPEDLFFERLVVFAAGRRQPYVYDLDELAPTRREYIGAIPLYVPVAPGERRIEYPFQLARFCIRIGESTNADALATLDPLERRSLGLPPVGPTDATTKRPREPEASADRVHTTKHVRRSYE